MRPLGRDILEKNLGKDRIDSIISYLLACQSPFGGFSQQPYSTDKYQDVGINTTASALWCLWHLEALNDSLNIKELLKFLTNLTVIGNDFCGFKNELNDVTPWTCSTYYGLRVYMTLHSNLPSFSISNQKIVTDHVTQLRENFGKLITNFIIKSFNNKTGGFGATPDSNSNLIHTKDALAILVDTHEKYAKLLGSQNNQSFLRKNIKKISKFLESCYFNGAYGFADKSYYQPNMYATYLGYKIRFLLIDACGKNKKCHAEHSGTIENMNITDSEKKKISEFIDFCYSSTIGGYKGYSQHEDFLPPQHIAQLAKDTHVYH